MRVVNTFVFGTGFLLCHSNFLSALGYPSTKRHAKKLAKELWVTFTWFQFNAVSFSYSR